MSSLVKRSKQFRAGVVLGALALLAIGIYIGQSFSVEDEGLVIGKKGSFDRPLLAVGASDKSSEVSSVVRDTREKRADLSQFLNQESDAVGQTIVDSAATLARVKSFSQKLSQKEMEKLKNVALDDAQPGDRRMLSVFMLAQVESFAVMAFLESIISTPITKNQRGSRHYEDELVIRAQAIEGVKKFHAQKGVRQSLVNLAGKLEDSFLVRRLNIVLSN